MHPARSIRTKLLALLAVPLVVLAGLAAIGVRWASGAAADSRATARHMELSLVASAAAVELALERGLSAAALADPQRYGGRELANQRGQTDVALTALRTTPAPGGDDGRSWADAVGALAALGPLRDRVDGGAGAAGSTGDTGDTGGIPRTLDEYTMVVDALLVATRDLDTVHDADLLTRSRAYQALTRAVDDMALEQSLLMSVLVRGFFDAAAHDRVVGLAATQDAWLQQFQAGASPADVAAYRDALDVPSVAAAGRLRDEALAAGPTGAVGGDADLWFTAMVRKVDLLTTLADGMATRLANDADGSRAAAERRQLAFVGLGLAALLLIVAVTVLVDRIVIRPVRRLTAAAHDVAVHSLPRAVEVAQAEGPDAARAAAVSIPVPTADEVGELTAAFNTVQDTAVALAAEQAALRRNVNEVFVNLGRRTQNLITRQLAHIDHLEAATDDPGALADLFLLDHLATRLRRNAESLLVLAGAESPRPWTRPVSVVNVVRAAAAEATDYSRVDLERLGDVAVIGAAVNDVSHLLAELIDNALAFSPPSERVVVSGAAARDGGYRVSVVDSGFGMSPDRLADANDRIAHPPVADLAMSRFFGLFVVGRLAQRHGIGVELAPSPGTGLTAHVALPGHLLVARQGDVGGRGPAARAAGPAGRAGYRSGPAAAAAAAPAAPAGPLWPSSWPMAPPTPAPTGVGGTRADG